MFTDLEYVYGTAIHTEKNTESLVLWRMNLTDTGGFGVVDTAQLPISELNDNSALNLLADAVSEGAWD